MDTDWYSPNGTPVVPVLVLFPDHLETEYELTCALFDEWNRQYRTVRMVPYTMYDTGPPDGPSAIVVLGRTGQHQPEAVTAWCDYYAHVNPRRFVFMFDDPQHLSETGLQTMFMVADQICEEMEFV